MDDVTRALEKAAQAMDGALPNQFKHLSPIVARAAVLACVQSLPPAMTVAELAAAIEKERI